MGTVAAMLALLTQLGVCAPALFDAPGGAKLTVLVCPTMQAPTRPPMPADDEAPKTPA